MFDKDGYYDVQDEEAQISASDVNLLARFQTKKQEDKEPASKSLADMIMMKLQSGDF